MKFTVSIQHKALTAICSNGKKNDVLLSLLSISVPGLDNGPVPIRNSTGKLFLHTWRSQIRIEGFMFVYKQQFDHIMGSYNIQCTICAVSFDFSLSRL